MKLHVVLSLVLTLALVLSPSNTLAGAEWSGTSRARLSGDAIFADLTGHAYTSEPVIFGSSMLPAEHMAARGSALQEEDSYVPWESGRRFWVAVGEVAILEFIPWALARWVRHWEDPAKNWAKVSPDTWWNNLSKGWEYDGDNFLTNQFSHPYHGALFFSAGRSNGYTFWESVPFALVGSAVWEHFGETYRPAFNDWVNTGFDGAFFGESLYRLSVLITDNTATGSKRVWQEIGGALVNPVRGFNRLISGETGRVFANPPEHSPGGFRPVVSAGVRRMDANGTDLVKDAVTQAIVSLDMQYGDLFHGSSSTPFSSFFTGIAIAFPNREEDSTGALNRVSVDGVLYRWSLSQTEAARHVLTARGQYDYVANPAFEFGQTSLSGEWNSLYGLSEEWKIQLGVGIRAILMGGTPTDYYVDVEGRNYDFGSGWGTRVIASLVSEGWDIATVHYNGGWMWTQSEPSASKHNFHIATIAARYPFSQTLAVGIELGMYWRQSYYEKRYFDAVVPPPAQPYEAKITRRHPMARLALSALLW